MHFLSHFRQEIQLEKSEQFCRAINSLDKMLETTVIFLLFYSHFGGAYNIDTTSPDIFSRRSNSSFGVSVALSKDDVYFGAPHSESHGNVYECSKSGSSCSKVPGKPIKMFGNHRVYLVFLVFSLSVFFFFLICPGFFPVRPVFQFCLIKCSNEHSFLW